MIGYTPTCAAGTATGDVWYAWSAGTTTATSSDTWAYWVDEGTGTATASAATATKIWVQWNGTTAGVTYNVSPRHAYQPPTEEEQKKIDAERIERAEKERIRQEKEKKDREEADKRAEELLKKHLDQKQREQYEKDKKFRVRSKDGAEFELASLWSGNAVELTPDGKRLARFCIHPREYVPIPDLLLAQKLMLETDPETFRKTANRSEIREPARVN